MNRYAILIYWNNVDSTFIAEVPELPGVIAYGETYQDAINRVEPVIEEWIHNARAVHRDIPKPKGRLTVMV
jgi:predicted RNase H-like HicB family nuclease